MGIETKNKVYLGALLVAVVLLGWLWTHPQVKVLSLGSTQTTPTYLTNPDTLSSQDSLYVWGTDTGQGFEVAGTSNLVGTVNARGALNVTGVLSVTGGISGSNTTTLNKLVVTGKSTLATTSVTSSFCLRDGTNNYYVVATPSTTAASFTFATSTSCN